VIHHGNAAELVGTLPPFDLVVTDPPYAMGGVDGEWRLTAEVAIALRDGAKVVKRRDGAMVVLAASSGRSIEFMSSAVGLPLKRVLTWHRPDARTAARSGWRFDTVLALVFGKVPPEGGQSSFISAPSPRPSGHKAEIPDEVADWLLAPWADPLTVLDPFCGSGALLAAAARRGHGTLGIDMDERWVAYSRERLAAGSPLAIDSLVLGLTA
jgi:16S rRNA G966 N2-methylase RsmD